MGTSRVPTGGMNYLSALCGMFTSHFSDEDRQRDVPPSRYGMGVMLRSHEIKAALTTEKERERRRGWDHERAHGSL